nr:hypothetical protein [Tanacetum cinerariifolium]
TTATTLDQQVALDEALVPSAQTLRIGRSNFQLPSNIQLKEPTLQVVYDVLRNSPFFRAFLVSADVPEIYMQELWATAKLHQHSIRFKMDTKMHVLDLEAFREMLHISPRIPGQPFDELPFEEEIMEFLRFLEHSTQIKTLTDVNVNKLYQPWRSFAAVINKCLTGKSYGIDSLGISQAQILWGLYHQSNVDYAYLIWEDFMYQVEHKHQKKSNEMYYPRFTKTSCSASSTTPPTTIATPTPTTTVVATPRLSAAAKDEGTGSRPGVSDVPSDNSEEELSWNSSNDEDVDEQTKGREESEGDKTDENADDDDEEENTKIGEQEEEESFDPIPRTPEDNEDDDNNEEDQGLRIGKEERMQEEEDAEKLYRGVNINQGRGLQVSQEIEDTHVILTPTQSDTQQESSSTSSFMTNLLNPITDPGLESLFITGSTIGTPIPSPQSTMTPSIISTFTSASQLPTSLTQILSLDLQSLPTFASVFRFEDRVKSSEDNFSNIPGIVTQYINLQMLEAVREAMQTQTTQLQDSIQRENDEFLKTIDENMKKIIKEQVKSQVKAQVTRILPRIEEATILDTYGESTILKRRREDDDREGPSAGSDRGLKRQREGGEHASASTPSEPATESAGRSTTGSQSRQLSANADDQPIIQTTQHPEWFSQSRRPPTPDRDWNKSVPAAQREAQS